MMPSFRLDGKVALVNGGSRGIGRAIAVAMAEAGADVAVAARTMDGLVLTANEIQRRGRKALIVPTDMREHSSIEAMVATTVREMGRIDILVNAAGVAKRQPAVEITEQDFDEVYTTNIRGITFACVAAGKHFVAQGSGRIINIGSLTSILGVPHRTLYGSTKGAIALLTKSLAVEWGPSGVCVNAIAPGWIETDFTRTMLAQPGVTERIVDRTPLKRVGQPEDLVGIAVYLASPAGAFTTGQVIVVDGGYSAG
jgi:NAD(P)-dependent dehydrogenase (short-subunit alcohol dehydrogenase family)